MAIFDTVYSPIFEHGWMNLGYSESPTLAGETYTDWCASLANQLAQAAELTAGDRVVDVGCGTGIQDLHFAKLVPGLDIEGVNISPAQVEVARERLKREGELSQSRVKFTVGDAIQLPFEDNWADKVLALESAFHFHTREKFFVEALRVLKPGGKLALAEPVTDATPEVLAHAWWDRGIFPCLRKLAGKVQVGVAQDEYSQENIYSIATYVGKLRQAGYEKIVVKDVSNHIVFFPNERFARIMPVSMMIPRPWNHRSIQPAFYIAQFSKWRTRYIVVTATKPSGPSAT